RQRTTERAKATIEWFVVHIDKALGLSDFQQERLVELLSTETPPPARYGQADFWFLMYQMTRLPDTKLKEILDEPQWRLLNNQFNQARGMGPWLRSNGLLAQGADVSSAPVAPPAIEARVRNRVLLMPPAAADEPKRKK